MRFTILAALAALAACTSPAANQAMNATASNATATTGPIAAPTGNAVNKQEIRTDCDAGPANFALGEPYTPELAERARAASGALTVRRLVPDQAVTMEYLASRLSLETDANNRVASVVCG